MLRAMLERCWPGSMLGSADFVRCRSGLGLGFWRNFCSSGPRYAIFDPHVNPVGAPPAPKDDAMVCMVSSLNTPLIMLLLLGSNTPC